MDTGFKDVILAIITCDAKRVEGGACPVFKVEDSQEQEKLSLLLARIMAGTVHDLQNGILVITRH